MKKKISYLLIAGMMSTAFMFQSCNEDQDNAASEISEHEEVAVATDSNDGDKDVEEEVQNVDMTLAGSNAEGGRPKAVCAEITKDQGAKLITLDFGTGCVGPYGRVRSGKIYINYGGLFNDSLANRVITFDNYVVNNKKITGTITLRDFNVNAIGQLTGTRTMNNVTITYPNNKTVTLNGTLVRTWIEGAGDDIVDNDVFSLTGSYEGVSTTGRSFTHIITEPIISSFACRAEGGFLRVDGVTEMTINNLRRVKVRTVDYGDGTCDNTFTITINNKPISVEVEG